MSHEREHSAFAASPPYPRGSMAAPGRATAPAGDGPGPLIRRPWPRQRRRPTEPSLRDPTMPLAGWGRSRPRPSPSWGGRRCRLGGTCRGSAAAGQCPRYRARLWLCALPLASTLTFKPEATDATQGSLKGLLRLPGSESVGQYRLPVPVILCLATHQGREDEPENATANAFFDQLELCWCRESL